MDNVCGLTLVLDPVRFTWHVISFIFTRHCSSPRYTTVGERFRSWNLGSRKNRSFVNFSSRVPPVAKQESRKLTTESWEKKKKKRKKKRNSCIVQPKRKIDRRYAGVKGSRSLEIKNPRGFYETRPLSIQFSFNPLYSPAPYIPSNLDYSLAFRNLAVDFILTIKNYI